MLRAARLGFHVHSRAARVVDDLHPAVIEPLPGDLYVVAGNCLQYLKSVLRVAALHGKRSGHWVASGAVASGDADIEPILVYAAAYLNPYGHYIVSPELFARPCHCKGDGAGLSAPVGWANFAPEKLLQR